MKFFKNLKPSRKIEKQLDELRDLAIFNNTKQLQQMHKNPMNRMGAKCFSQSDEDGITLEILRRIGNLDNGSFAEFGVGNGTENNTLILRSLGWTGFWVGGEDLAFHPECSSNIFSYSKSWVTLKNIAEITTSLVTSMGIDNLDLISLDFDGNDYYFVNELLRKNFLPKIFIVEYNAKFIPPVDWKIDYDENHRWGSDDYFGASLTSFVRLFDQFGYRLICCNSHTGANAFFVKNEYASNFSDIPEDPRDIYVEPRYFLYKSYGHKASLKTISSLFSR